jgi:hypothetical protein
MRLDSVEAKLTIAGNRVGAAVEAFDLPRDPQEWKIYFAEDVARSTSPRTPLLAAGVILRGRDRSGNKGDSTVKLRPGRRSQLTKDWLDAAGEFKIDADWAGENKVLAISLTADCSPELISAVALGQQPASELFTEDQRELLDECADIRVNLDALVLLGPVRAARWKEVPGGEEAVGVDVKAERWTLHDGQDFLEFSIESPPDTAVEKQVALEKFVRRQGFAPGAEQVPKTALVLQGLAAMEAAR